MLCRGIHNICSPEDVHDVHEVFDTCTYMTNFPRVYPSLCVQKRLTATALFSFTHPVTCSMHGDTYPLIELEQMSDVAFCNVRAHSAEFGYIVAIIEVDMPQPFGLSRMMIPGPTANGHPLGRPSTRLRHYFASYMNITMSPSITTPRMCLCAALALCLYTWSAFGIADG